MGRLAVILRRVRWQTALWVVVAMAVSCTDPGPVPVALTPVVLPGGPVPPGPRFLTPTPAPTPTPEPIHLEGPLTVAVSTELPEEISLPLMVALNQIDRVQAANGLFPVRLLDQVENADTVIDAVAWPVADAALAQRVFAVVAPFYTFADDIALDELRLRWQGAGDGPVLAAASTAQLLTPILGTAAAAPVNANDLLQTLEAVPGSLAIVPFDHLHPRWKTLTVDGVNVLDNHFDPAAYALTVALRVHGQGAAILAPVLSHVITPTTNRDARQLTTLIMTGVTAMSRGTAAAIARNSPTYPAEVISDTLAAADITHISNEVPFLEDCEVNNTENNLVLCSHTSYWAALAAVGTDIVGLSGNHVNDFGRDGARESLQYYRDHDIPIYGSGLTVDEACAPLRWEHNGNTFAFVATLAFGPETAWVTDEEPGACYYYEHKERILALVEEMAQEVDIVAVELQYMEIYEPFPANQQVIEFRELRDAGADLVTGVQSHVPQAMETYGTDDPGGPGAIVYGLGNLFFDQMWSWPTRTELMARHTIYAGRLLNTEILTAVLEDFAQPRWATPEERADILTRIFYATPPRPE